MRISFKLPVLVLLLLSPQAFAYTDFSPGNLSGVNQGMVDEMLKVSAIGTSFRAYQPASNLGFAIGLDAGIDVAAIVLPDDFKQALLQATQNANIPSMIPIPRLNVHKGFPAGIDLGFSYATYQTTFSVWGLDAQWNFFGGGVKPSLAGRFSYSHSKLYFIQTHTINLDVVASKGLTVIEPYVGTGMQFWGGELNVPAGGATGLPVSVSSNTSGTTGHVFVGIPLKLLILHITGELDYSFAGVTTYGGKISLSF